MLSFKIINFFFIKSFFFKHILNELYFFLLYLNDFFTYSLIALPNRIKKFTVVKSPFVSKLSREQFEIRSYKVILSLANINYTFLGSSMVLISSFFKNSYISYRLKVKCY